MHFFDRVVWARLTINLAKCEIAKATVTNLGKVVGQGQVHPVQAKVMAVSSTHHQERANAILGDGRVTTAVFARTFHLLSHH